MKYVLLILLCMSVGAHANSCLQPDTSKVIMKAPVQDQDGLGICYAATGSLLLQQALGSPDPLSYHMIAVGYATMTNNAFEGGNLFKPFQKPATSLAMDGGSICGAVKSIKRTGICRAVTFPLDAHGSVDPWNRQLKVLEAYAEFVDRAALSAGKMDGNAWKALEVGLADLIRKNQQDCRLPLNDRFLKQLAEQIPRALHDGVARYQRLINKHQAEVSDPLTPNRADSERRLRNSRAWLKIYEGLAQSLLRREPLGRNPDRARYVLTDAAMSDLRAQVPTYMRALGQTRTTVRNTANEVLYDVNLPDMESPLATLYRTALKNGAQIQSTIPKLFLRDVFTTWAAIRAHSSLANCNVALDASDAFRTTIPDLIAPVCDGVLRPNPVVDLAVVQAQGIVEALKQTTTPHLIGRTNPLLNILAPSCVEELGTSVPKLQSLQCDSVSLLPIVKQEDPDITDDLSRESAARRLARSQDWVMQRLCKGQPVAVDICTGFLNGEGSADGEFCRKSVGNPNRTDSNHAVVIVGYEVLPDRKVRYLVQNSWGRTCPFNDPKISAGKDAFCERDRDSGGDTGRFWISDRVLLTNSFKLNAVSRAP